MRSLNRATLIGNLGRDPEVRHLSDNRPVCQLSLATSDRWTDKQTGEVKERTEWHRVVIYVEGLVKVAQDYLRKGSAVMIEGSIRTRQWQDQEGKDRWTTEITVNKIGGKLIMLDKAEGSGQQDAMDDAHERDALDDEIPF